MPRAEEVPVGRKKDHSAAWLRREAKAICPMRIPSRPIHPRRFLFMKRAMLLGLVLLFAVMPVCSGAEITPSQLYMTFDETLRKATTLKEIMPFLTEGKRTELAQMSEAEQEVKLIELRMGRPDRVKVNSTKITGDRAELRVEGYYEFQSMRIKGRVVLAREKGEWKFDGELWDKAS
jgi:hypothetical protein